MNNYEKYHKIDEYIDSLKLSQAEINNYKRTLSELDEIRELEATEELNDFDRGRKEEKIKDLDNFIADFIETKRKKIEDNIDQFKNKVEELNERINTVSGNLILEAELDFELNNEFVLLNAEMEKLNADSKTLISEIDDFKKYLSEFSVVDFSMNYHDINKELTSLKRKFRDLKRRQVDIYNARVEYTNKLINELRGIEGLSEEVSSKIQMLEELNTCDVTVRTWDQTNYLDKIDYVKLNQVVTMALEIQKDIRKVEEKNKDNFLKLMDLNSCIEYIERKLNKLDNKEYIKEFFAQDLLNVSSRINDFEVKLNNFKDLLTEEEYNKFYERLNDAQIYAAELNKKHKKEVKPIVIIDDFAEYRDKLNLLETEINSFSDIVEALYGNILNNGLNALKVRQETFENRLSNIYEEIEKANDMSKFFPNQYAQLVKKVEELEKILEHTRENIKEPNMVKEVDIFTYLDGSIDGLEKSIESLDKQLDSYGNNKIRDKRVRREIDKKFARLEKEIKFLEEKLELEKENNPEKYEEYKEKLNSVKDKLDKLGKKYRMHCPLLVKGVKSAKNFYKKHKKVCLIAAGLAAVALVHATVGPVIIPAIMHGNIMIGFKSPALRGFANFVNNVLGGLIGASKDINGAWFLANGAMINPSVASTSLLKGLAISGLGSAAVVAPLIAGVITGVKKLNQKTKTFELKEKLKSDKEKLVGLKEKINNKKAKKSSAKEAKLADKISIEELSKLLIMYRKSGVSLDEFCSANDLTEKDKAIIEYLDSKSKENVENVSNGRKGR